jgi:hypothetical protein
MRGKPVHHPAALQKHLRANTIAGQDQQVCGFLAHGQGPFEIGYRIEMVAGCRFRSRLTLIYAYSNDNSDINASGVCRIFLILLKQAGIFPFPFFSFVTME